ncbi:MFS transporter [Streptomyces paradoxus]|uniref:MFS transporter n=1 Tax=Streptomyces paradoxus TaxID=66375 RepID=UPI0037FBA04A
MTLMLEAAEMTRTPRRTAPPTWLVVALTCAGQFLVVLDVSVVNVALPSMRTGLGLSEQGLQWVVNAYAIAFAGFMLLGGRAGDLYGRKRMFLVGLGLFTPAGWTAPATLLPLVAGLALLGAFLAVEARTASPLMPLGLLRIRSVSSANASMFLCGSAMFCMWFFMTLYAQHVLGYTPLEAGLALVPSSLAVILGSKLAPRLMPPISPRNVAALGTLVAVAGFAWQSTMTPDGSYATAILVPGVLMMLGAGLAATPLASLATSGAAPGEAGLVSGLVNTSRTMGGSLGLAVLSTLAAARSAGSTTPQALTEGYALAFRVGAVVLTAGVALMWVWLPRTAVEREA